MHLTQPFKSMVVTQLFALSALNVTITLIFKASIEGFIARFFYMSNFIAI